MKQLVLLLGLWLLCSVNMHAQIEFRIGMEKREVMRLFGEYIVSETPTGGITLRMPFYGHDADVYLGFYRADKVQRIEASFTSFLGDSNRTNRLSLFRDVRQKLEQLSGRPYSYARIDGIDVLGESGGWITYKKKMNAFVFGTVHDGLVYQVEISAETISSLAQTGEVSLTIDKEESVGNSGNQ